MAVVIKFLAASGVSEINLSLQCSIDTPNVMLYYHKKGFINRKNLITEKPPTLHVPKDLFINQKHMVLAECSHGYFSVGPPTSMEPDQSPEFETEVVEVNDNPNFTY